MTTIFIETCRTVFELAWTRINPKGSLFTVVAARLLLSLLSYSLVGTPAYAAETDLPIAEDVRSHGVTQNELEALSDIIREGVEQNRIAGASVLVAHKGEVVFRDAFRYADLETKRAFTTEEFLPIASVSKPFLASVVMVLVEQGKLNLDDPVEKYLPEFRGVKVEGQSAPAKAMTVRHFMAHTAG